MQRIIKNGQVIDESWHLIPNGISFNQLPNSDDLIVPLALWREHAHGLKVRDGRLGVWLESHDEVEEIFDDLPYFQVIALDFPIFTDGRHFSSARLLRERYHYKKEIRAIGDVLPDQLCFMRRCGFDAFAMRPDQEPILATAYLNTFSNSYQGDTDNPQPLFRRR